MTTNTRSASFGGVGVLDHIHSTDARGTHGNNGHKSSKIETKLRQKDWKRAEITKKRDFDRS